jgi:uncharacterized membrane protein YkvA (DUF1232 family)
MRDLMVIGLAGLAALYLINPTLGVIEFLPDNFPLIGNLDEATATAILIAALSYFGLDLDRLLGRRHKLRRRDPHVIDEPRFIDEAEQEARQRRRR